MNKKNRSALFIYLIGAILSGGAILLYETIRLESERLLKEKASFEELLSAKRNIRLTLEVEAQKLEAENRIVDLAVKKLGMIKNTAPGIKITISKSSADIISKIIDEKYEHR